MTHSAFHHPDLKLQEGRFEHFSLLTMTFIFYATATMMMSSLNDSIITKSVDVHFPGNFTVIMTFDRHNITFSITPPVIKLTWRYRISAPPTSMRLAGELLSDKKDPRSHLHPPKGSSNCFPSQ
jgi:hypothetical protein